jgi:hypothetical protein
MIAHPGGLGDAPIEDKHRAAMVALAKGIDDILNGEGTPKQERKVGFCLLVFDFGEGPGRANYISNAKREDIVVLLKEQLTRWEGMAEPKEGNA